jgi:hypothetical protein
VAWGEKRHESTADHTEFRLCCAVLEIEAWFLSHSAVLLKPIQRSPCPALDGKGKKWLELARIQAILPSPARVTDHKSMVNSVEVALSREYNSRALRSDDTDARKEARRCVGPTTPTRARRPFDASVDHTEARNDIL